MARWNHYQDLEDLLKLAMKQEDWNEVLASLNENLNGIGLHLGDMYISEGSSQEFVSNVRPVKFPSLIKLGLPLCCS